MIPTIASSGGSFKGAAAYYLHDKDADTRERVAWTHVENLPTNNPDRAWKVMAWTAKHQDQLKEAAGVRAGGRKLEKPVFAFSVSWHPEQKPDKAHMLATAKAAATVLGLTDHQAIFVCHNDEPQPHVHILVNRVHPETGRAATLSKSKEKLSAWALAYEQEHGRIYCDVRAQNAKQRAMPAAERAKVPSDRPTVIETAWKQSDSGKSFQAALKAEGLTLAQGNRRLVVIDRYGKAINPTRQLPGVRAAAFASRLVDLDFKNLPTAAAAQKAARAGERKQYHAARKFDRWSAEHRNNNQSRQIEERAALSARYLNRINDKKELLDREYKTGELRQKIAALQERTERPSIFRRLTGAADRDHAALEACQKQLADVEQRTGEQVDAIASARDQAMAELVEQHAQEKERLQEYLVEQWPTFYVEEQEVGRSAANRSRDRGGGRERVHYRTYPGASPAI